MISSCLAAYIFGVSIILSSPSLMTTNQTFSNMTTSSGHSTSNCITTDSACLFSRNIQTPDQQDDFQPIAARRKQIFSQIIPQHGSVKNNSNLSVHGPSKTNGSISNLELRSPVKEHSKNQTNVPQDEIRSSKSITMTRPLIAHKTPDLFSTKMFSCVFTSNQSSIHKALLFPNPCYG